MLDDMIVSLYWNREEDAIRETEKKYGGYLTKIAYNILFDFEDSRESVNDTYLKAWNSMPPNRPNALCAYLSKITRHLSIDMYRKKNSLKRKASQYDVSLSELENCVSQYGNTTEQSVDMHLLSESISAFLKALPIEPRNIFICRYYFMDTIRDIASYYAMSEAKVKSMLHRTRLKLKLYLQKEGFDL